MMFGPRQHTGQAGSDGVKAVQVGAEVGAFDAS